MSVGDNVFYKLVNNVPVACTVDEYSQWDGHITRKLFSHTENGFLISTVFLGVNLGFMERDQFFETMAFRMTGDTIQWDGVYEDRYATYEEAKEGHEYARRYIRCLMLA